MTNPDVTFWINQFAPGNLNRKIPAADQPKTVDEILAQLKRHNKAAGDPLVLDAEFSFYASLDSATMIAIPIRSERRDSTCPQGCQVIQEIQVYRALELPKLIRLLQRQRRFRRVNRLLVGGPSEQDLNRLVRSLTQRGSSEGSTSPMAISDFKIEETEDKNRWIILSGLKAKGYATASFGQILHINPKQTQLNVMLNWVSPSGQFPVWQDLTGDGQAEIVIDQSIELEPSFSVYEIQRAPNGALWVTPIGLSKAAIATQPYQNALKLAKSGLWVQALNQLEPMRHSKEWSSTAQAQYEFIKLHAETLHADDNLAFSDPVAEIQRLLIQGAWREAQVKLMASRDILEAVRVVLVSDNGQISDRIQTAAQVGSDKDAAMDWGIIYHHAKGGKAQAEQWINTHHPAHKSRLAPLLKKLTSDPKQAISTPSIRSPSVSSSGE